ncbi:MAG: hypothetical protein H0T68_07320 [Gemmatimonadales bacterium]|nr:hypothetical protein [Gemmatimonadales bacterium]
MLISRILSRRILALLTVVALGVVRDVEAQAAGVLQAEVQVVDFSLSEAGLLATRVALGAPRSGDLEGSRGGHALPIVRREMHEGEHRIAGAPPARVVVLVLYLR